MELQIWPGDWGLPSTDPQCLTVITYCRMCGFDLPTAVVQGTWNGRRLPVLTLAESGEYLETPQNIINLLISRDSIQMDDHLTEKNRSETIALTSMVTESLYTAMLCALWLDEENFESVAMPSYKEIFKLPLSYFKAYEMRRFVRCLVLARHSLDDNTDLSVVLKKVYDSSKRCLQILASKLGNQPFLFGEVPSQLDAYVFAHLAIIRACPAKSRLKDDMQKLTNLDEYTLHIHKKYYPKLYRNYTPVENTEHWLMSKTKRHQLASLTAVLALVGVFVWYRAGSRLHINDRALEPR